VPVYAIRPGNGVGLFYSPGHTRAADGVGDDTGLDGGRPFTACVAGMSRHYHSSSSSNASSAATAVNTFSKSGMVHHRRSTPWRVATSKAAAASGGISSATQSSSQQMYYCRTCMIGCAGPQVKSPCCTDRRVSRKMTSVETCEIATTPTEAQQTMESDVLCQLRAQSHATVSELIWDIPTLK